MATRPAIPFPSATSSAEDQTNIPVIIAAAAGAVILLIFSVLIAILLIRKKRKQDKKVLLRGPPSKISLGVGGGGATGDIPLRYASNIMTMVEGSQPSLSLSGRLDPPIPRSIPPLQEGAMNKQPRPAGIHERYPSPYTASALEKAYEILERNVTSPIPSYISGYTDGAGSRVVSAQPSSDLNHGHSFRSFDQSPPRPTLKSLFPQAFDPSNSERPGTSGSTRSRPGTSGSTRSRPGTSGSTRSRNRIGGEQIVPVVRRPSEVRRTELLTALWSTETVAVVGRPSLPSRPTTASRLSTVGELQQPEIDTDRHEITDQDITNARGKFASLSENFV